MKLKKMMLLASCMLLTTTLASCNNNDDTISGTSNNSQTSYVPSDVLDIEFWTTTGKGIEENIAKLADDFEEIIYENEGRKINFSINNQGNYDGIKDKITQGLSTGNYPTIAIAYPDHVASYMADKPGSVVNLLPLINDEKIGFTKETIDELDDNYGVDDFVQAYYQEGTNYAQEGVYSLPFLKSSEVMVVNQDYVLGQTFGRDRPIQKSDLANMTWDELMDICKYIVENKDSIKGLPADLETPLWIDSDSNFFITQSMQRGIPYLGDGDTPDTKVLFNNPQAKEMVNEFYDCYNKGYFTTKGNNGGDYGSNAFKEGKVLITLGSSGGVGYNDLGASSIEGVGVYKIPSAAENEEDSLYVSQGITLCIMSNEGHGGAQVDQERINYAFRFIKYLLNPDNNVRLALSSEGYVPVRESAINSAKYQAYLEYDSELLVKTAKCVINDINGAYYNLPIFKGSDVARTAVEGIVGRFSQVKAGGKTIDQLFEEAENQAKASL